MKRVILAAGFAAIAFPAFAQTPPKTYVLSEALVNEIYTTLAKDPYSQVATVLSHLQAEVLKQPAPAVAPKPTEAEPAK
jgi:hypothetical protein